jgi:hypothetical protein
MKETPHFSDLTNSLLPRALEPELAKAEGSPETTEDKPYELTVEGEPGSPFTSASVEDEPNPLMEIVEEGMDAGGDPTTRKVPHDERSTVGTIAPSIT